METQSSHPLTPTIRVALLDLYEGVPNEGMRCLRNLIHEWGEQQALSIELHEFDVRKQQELPDTTYDVYISSGGPGSPLESEGEHWEHQYFGWIKSIEAHNQAGNGPAKHILFICNYFDG